MLSVPSFEAAENSAAQHMRALGFPDAKVTPRGADGGIDVTSSRAIAQVKWHISPTGRPDVQKLYGARGRRHHLEMLFFSASGYTAQAVECANELKVALFTIDQNNGLIPRNKPAQTMMARERREQVLLFVVFCLLVILTVIREFPKLSASIVSATGWIAGVTLLIQGQDAPATFWMVLGVIGLGSLIIRIALDSRRNASGLQRF
ncbi:restriction endonuclease [Nocardia sputi]|uniref:restriction endonuclease n=1 Tax=Nocardia sputi TaxID=2943705 RepID=UPI0020BDF751|nr:restriction endonuclease [Nocardia sputi]